MRVFLKSRCVCRTYCSLIYPQYTACCKVTTPLYTEEACSISATVSDTPRLIKVTNGMSYLSSGQARHIKLCVDHKSTRQDSAFNTRYIVK